MHMHLIFYRYNSLITISFIFCSGKIQINEGYHINQCIMFTFFNYKKQNFNIWNLPNLYVKTVIIKVYENNKNWFLYLFDDIFK